MRLSRWKKFAPHLIIATALIATVVPTLGAHLLNELTPYLNLTSVTAKPESVELESMEIVDKKYEKYAVDYVNYSSSSKKIQVKYNIWEIEGIYLQNDYGKKGAPNYYNSELVLAKDKTIDLSRAPLPGSGLIPVVVEYYIREWTEITWALGLKVNNRGDDTIIFPRANLTLNFLEDNLAKGWISREYEIKGHESKMIKAYLVMKNDRFFETFLCALLLGEPLDLKLGLEAYILAEGLNDEPLVPIVYPVDMDFSMPELSRGPAPFIHSITRAHVSANQPVKISVSGSDEGTGISNRTYIYYSIDGGASWESVLLTGGEWWNEYAGVPFKSSEELIGRGHNRFPIRSTIEPETYEGEIPSFSAGTQVLFKVYLEDYAANINHVDKGNWVWSQTYSYVVPGSGELPEFTVEFKKSTEESLSKKLDKYLELNGFIQDYYLKTQGVNSNLYVTEKLPDISDFLYKNDVDSSYAIEMLLLDMNKATDILADSGVARGSLLDVFGLSFKDLFAYIVDNIFLPTKQETDLGDIAKHRFEEIRIINAIEGAAPGWSTWPSGTVITTSHNLYIPDNNDPIGQRSLKWTVSAPANLSYNPNVLIDLSKNDLISFYLDYDNYKFLNENLSVTLIDNNGREMTSKQIYFEETAFETWQEITLPLALFTKDTGFNLEAIDQINFTYSGTEVVDIHIDYIMAYSMESYALHQYITRELRVKTKSGGIYLPSFEYFLYFYQGTGYGTDPPLPSSTEDPIMPDFAIEWVAGAPQHSRYTSGWYFLKLVGTNGTFEYPYGPDPNHHICGAATFLQYVGFSNGYKKLCELFGVEFDEFDEEAFTKEEIYPYTQTLATFMVYIPLGAVAALAIVLKVRQHRYKTKVKKIRNKYTKIGKR